METTEFWKNHNYELVLTEDQSPTLRWLGSETLETMHHRGGAYSETQLIYGNPLRDCLQAGGRSALSVGLGLGYNEILTATEAVRSGIAPQEFRLLSFEVDDFLKTHFLNWVEQPSTALVYDRIFEFFQGFEVGPVKQWLKAAYAASTWKLEGPLLPEFEISGTYECLFYDAFSSKTSPHLWQEEFLTHFWAQACAPRAWVSTYACTGALKRSLRAAGFQVILREGFHSKRNSTLGVRTISSAP